MPAGDSFTPAETERLGRAVQHAERISGLTFSVYVGPSQQDSRAYAERLHAALDNPARSVLIMCDPIFRALEIVTGTEVRRQLDDVECRLAAATMRTSFEADDIVGGLVHGIAQLGEAAYQPPTLHATR